MVDLVQRRHQYPVVADFGSAHEPPGTAYNALGMYFLFRFLVRDFGDIKRAFKIAAVCIIPLAAAMVQERITGRDPFAVFGVRNAIVQVRDGALRCSGPFEVPMLAGTFAATLLPFFVALWQQGRADRLLSGLAILSSATIIFTTASSGPYLTALVAVVGLLLWPWRKYMRTLRWAVVLVLITLQVIMKSPSGLYSPKLMWCQGPRAFIARI